MMTVLSFDYIMFFFFIVEGRCQADEFMCVTDSYTECIPSSMVCNGQADCLDGSDEPHGCSKYLTIISLNLLVEKN